MTIRMYLILLFVTILAFSGLARAEEREYMRLNPEIRTQLELLNLDVLKIPPSRSEMMIKRHFTTFSQVLELVPEEELNQIFSEKLLARAKDVKLNECIKTYEFDYFAYTAAGGSLFQNSEDAAVQKEQQRLYRDVRAYLINGKLIQRDPTAVVAPELAQYCETFASGQTDVLAVQFEGIHALASLLGQVLTDVGGFFSRLSGDGK